MAEGSIQKARVLLAEPAPTTSPWPLLAAAGLAAAAAVMMAGVMVLGPGVRFDTPVAAQPLFPNG